MTMPRRSLLAAALAAATLGVPAAALAQQQAWPARPIRLLVGFAPGGGTDIVARTLAPKLSELLGQQVIVENRAGAAGTIAADAVAKAAPDGYMLLAGHANSNAIAPYVLAKVPYDAITDFTPITYIGYVPNVLVVSPSSGVKSVRDLVELSKKRPNGLLYASAGIGSSTHLNGEVVRAALGLQAQHVPFKGVPEGLTDVIGGRVDFFMVPLVASLSQLKAGKLLGLAVGTNKRSSVLPDLPTLVETYPNAGFDGWFGLLASSKSPRALVGRLNRDVNKVLSMPEVRELFLTQGAETMSMTPEQFDKFLAAEVVRLGKVVRESGAKAE